MEHKLIISKSPNTSDDKLGIMAVMSVSWRTCKGRKSALPDLQTAP
jgi:hypothetical protein